MPFKDSDLRFGAVSKLLHWITALAIAGTVSLAWIMQDLPLGVAKFQAYGWHKSVGVAILTATVLRLAWRAINRRPLPVGGPVWQHRIARAVHAAFYACLLGLPMLGWLHSAAANTPVSVFGWFTLPQPIAPDRTLIEPLRFAHATLAWLLLGLVALHLLGILKHWLVDGDDILLRMLPFVGGRSAAASGAREPHDQ